MIAATRAMNLLARSTFNFCMHKALLDPSKHITMNRRTHNMFIDSVEIG